MHATAATAHYVRLRPDRKFVIVIMSMNGTFVGVPSEFEIHGGFNSDVFGYSLSRTTSDLSAQTTGRRLSYLFNATSSPTGVCLLGLCLPNKLLVHITALQVRLVCNGGSVLLVSRALILRTFRTMFASNAISSAYQCSCVITVRLRKTTTMMPLPLTRHVPNDIDHKFVLLSL